MNVGSAPLVRFPPVAALVGGNQSTVPMLDHRSVHVWGFSLQGSEAVTEAFHRSLSDEERARAARFIHREHQLRYILAHGGLRAVLARYSEEDPSAVRLYAGATGKPSLMDRSGQPQAIRFNLSHSHDRMLIAVAQGQEIGVDVERVRENVEAAKLAERFFAQAEYQHVLRCSGEERMWQFYRYWVAKEAVLKGQGVGITSLHDCEILAADANAVRSSVRLTPHTSLIPGWFVCWLDCGAGWQGAVSASGTDWDVQVLDL